MYRGLKSDFLHYYGLQDWMMHLVLGAAFYAVVFAATRKPWFTLYLLVGLQLGNEVIDLHEQASSPHIDYRQSIADTLWTVALPTSLAGTLAAFQAVVSLLPSRR